MEGIMVTLESLRHDKRAAILEVARRHGARAIRVYGSVARGQATDQSDLDLLVEWEPERSLLDVVGLKQDLEDMLGVTVDVGSECGLHWYIRDEVLREAVPLY
jgi:predicted nucleotidyltransferase